MGSMWLVAIGIKVNWRQAPTPVRIFRNEKLLLAYLRLIHKLTKHHFIGVISDYTV